MKSKSCKFLLPIISSLIFIMAFFVSNSVKASATSLDFYYPNNGAASKYNQDGSVELKSDYIVYIHNNGAGYSLDNDKLRIGSIKITSGSTSKTISSHYSFSSVSDYNSLNKNVYGALPSSKLQAITIDLKSAFPLPANYSSNDISIEINLQQGKFALWGAIHTGWESYSRSTVNSYVGGVKQSSNSVTVKVTDTSFANSSLHVNGVALSKSSYNNSDLNNGTALNLTLQTTFKFSGTIYAYYGSESTEYVELNYNNALTSSVNLKDTVIKQDIQDTITFNKFTIKSGAKDKYGTAISNINYTSENTVSVSVDTLAPTVTSAGIINTVGTFYDINSFDTQFNFNESVTFTLNSVFFKVGDALHTRTCSENCQVSTTNDALNFVKSYDLSGNGKVVLIAFAGTLQDTAGNITTYTQSNSASVCTANADATLVSSIKSATSNKSYYYNGESVGISIELTDEGIAAESFSKIKVSLSEGEDYVFSSIGKAGAILNVNYLVGDAQLTLNQLSIYKLVSGQEVLVFEQEVNIHLNSYLDLGLNDTTIVNPESNLIVLYTSDDPKTIDASKIKLQVVDAAISSVACDSTAKNAYCLIQATKDGSDKIVLESGAITLNNGLKNSQETFTVVVNTRAPLVNITLNQDNIATYDTVIYYKDGQNLVSFNMEDGSGDNMCVYYKFKESDEFSLNCSDGNVSLPESDGTYTLYYYTTDGENESAEVTYDKTFIYRGSFNKADINIILNEVTIDQSIDNINANKKYNNLTLKYENAKKLDLLKSFDAIINSQTKVNITANEEAKTFNVVASELGSLDDTVVVSISLTDMLGNVLKYEVRVNIDTIAPDFESIVAQSSQIDSKYNVTISGYGDNSIYVKVDGVRVDLTNSSFVSEKEKYTIVLTDLAGNVSEKVFTTIPPSVELNLLTSSTYDVKYEIYIAPFDETIHVVEEYKYFVFDYMSDVDDHDIEVARNNICTAGRKTNCYVNGSFRANSGLITQTLDRGYSYVLSIKINNVLANEVLTGKLPRLDILEADAVKPVGEFLDDDVNPDYISSTSGKDFEFKFLANDSNLTSSYYYLIVTENVGSRMNVSNFYELYKNCYGATSSSNGCGIRGENEYDSLYSEDTYLGIITVTANVNTKRRMQDNTNYSLYVLLSDVNNNTTLFKVRDFKNITKAATIKYLDDEGLYQEIRDGESVTTVNSSIAKITIYNSIELEKVVLDDIERTCSKSNGCELTLGVGKRVLEVEDVLGNKSLITIYSAIANNPVIQVNYNNAGEYFRILDNAFAYNTNNAGNVYVKVVGKDLRTIRVTMNSTGDYQASTPIFTSITDTSSQYGVSLLWIMDQHNGNVYSGDVTITAINLDGGESSVTLTVDNENPIITLLPEGKNVVNLLGEYYDLIYSSGQYEVEFNYQRDITYGYLMNALYVKADGIEFDTIKDNNRFKVKVDGTKITDFDESISKGIKTITIDYFDNAGNIANTVTIKVTSIDDEKPIISLNNVLNTVELNSSVNLANVLVSDNHDADQDLILIVKIDGTTIDHTNYKFNTIGEFVITYEVRDTSNNVASITQNILVRDTTGPSLKQGTVKEYSIGLDKELIMDMPIFVDTDSSSSEYRPHEIRVFNKNDFEIDKQSSVYPLIVDGNSLKFRFANSLGLGEFKVMFIVQDSSNNATEEIFTINVIDDAAPVIEVKVNNKNVNNGDVIDYAWGSSITLTATAIDGYEGNIDSDITRKITLNGSKVNSVDTKKNGTYVLEYKVKDAYDNEAIFTFSIVVSKDTTAPIINKVYVNDIEISSSSITKINGDRLHIVVDASDDFGTVESKIRINDNYNIDSGKSISIESDISGRTYTLKVIVNDSSENETVKEYTIMVDNRIPQIGGFENNNVYYNEVVVSASDENISTIKIYKNGVLDRTLNMNVYDLKISASGVYTIVVEDSYGNSNSASFAIMENKIYNVVDANNTPNNYNYDYTLLIETEISGDTLIFNLVDNSNISNKDRVYILVNYPNSDYKYVAYSMDGNTFLANEKVTLDQPIIAGAENVDLLEKINDKYYAYVMVVKGNDSGDNAANNGEGMSSSLKGALIFVLVTAGIGLTLFLVIKIRRKVRAV